MTTFGWPSGRGNARALAATGLLRAAFTALPGTAGAVADHRARPFTGPALFHDFNHSDHTDPLIPQHGWTL